MDGDDEDGDASKDAALVGVEMPTGWELDPAEATLPPTAKSWLAAWRRLLVVRALQMKKTHSFHISSQVRRRCPTQTSCTGVQEALT